MAIGIVTYDVLPRLFFITLFLRHLIVIELLIVWLYFFFFFTKSTIEGSFNLFITNGINQLGVGTWIAGSSVLALLFIQEMPLWYGVIWICELCALAIWPIYMILSLNNLKKIFLKKIRIHSGNLLLITVSTQAITLLTHILFAPSFPISGSRVLILLGYACYLVSIMIIGKYIFSCTKKRLFLGWSNGNSIIHGALSISGLASTITQAMSEEVILSTWYLASILLCLVEGMGLIKLYYRIKISGFIEGVFVYNLSQWTRIFTLGMYYSFTLALYKRDISSNFIVAHVIALGKYIVFLIFIFEIFIFFRDKLSFTK
ncbi:hypothetical protein [Legionella wadsworthii]|nr:hypothetical protein [Legionella wadsworthii]